MEEEDEYFAELGAIEEEDESPYLLEAMEEEEEENQNPAPLVAMEEPVQNPAQQVMNAVEEEVQQNGGKPVKCKPDPVLDIKGMELFEPEENEKEDEEEDDDWEEVEDVDSDGPCDEEVQKVVDELQKKSRMAAKVDSEGARTSEMGHQAQQPVIEQSAMEQPATEKPVEQLPTAPALVEAPTQQNSSAQQQSSVQPQSPAQQPATAIVNFNEMTTPRLYSLLRNGWYLKQQLWLKCPRRENQLPSNVREMKVEETNPNSKLFDIARGTIEALGLSPGKDFITAFKENFFLGVCLTQNPEEKFFCRCNPRNFLFDPPIIDECIDDARLASEEKKAKVIVRRDQYPKRPKRPFGYLELLYCEDTYWIQRVHRIPTRIKRPPRSFDFEKRREGYPRCIRTLYIMEKGNDDEWKPFLKDCFRAMEVEARRPQNNANPLRANRPKIRSAEV